MDPDHLLSGSRPASDIVIAMTRVRSARFVTWIVIAALGPSAAGCGAGRAGAPAANAPGGAAPTAPSAPGGAAPTAPGVGQAFDAEEAEVALMTAAAEVARGCPPVGAAAGKGEIEVVFAPTGDVTSAAVQAPYLGTPTGDCVVTAFVAVRVSPFDGAAVKLRHSFTIE